MSIAPVEMIPADLRPVLAALCAVGRDVANVIAKGPLGQSLAAAVGENAGGDGQKALDVIADEMFASALGAAGVRWYASEEQDDALELNPQGGYALAIDPLDGSSNIDCNVSIGTIFSVLPAEVTSEASFLRPMNEQIAGGYIIFGPQTALVVTWGEGVEMFVMDPASGVFTHVPGEIAIPASTKEYAINASNRRHWPTPVHSYVQSCEAGDTGPRAKNYNMRWVASLVAETHRILSRGGVFLYPGDARKGYEQGRLRMLYECAPIAFLIEQAGGQATNGRTRVLDQSVDRLHMRTPFVFGAAEEVAEVKRLWG